MAWTKEQKREARASQRRRLEPRFDINKKDAQLDTLRHFVVRKRVVSRVALGRCDACDAEATITDGYMLICSNCDMLLTAEVM